MSESKETAAKASEIKIEDIPFFRGLGGMELMFIMGVTQNIRGKRGQFLFCEGQDPNGLFIVLSGKCSIRLTNISSNSFSEIKSVNPGDYVGEFGLIDGLPRSATVIVTEDADLMFLPTKAFQSAIQTQPKVAQVVTQNLLMTIRENNIIIKEKEGKELVYSGRPVPSDMDTMRKLVAILRASNSNEQTDYWDR
jgi:signal-transduction protein with cAMP-binding, CBS, and nucleotidyltransferase domain